MKTVYAPKNQTFTKILRIKYERINIYFFLVNSLLILIRIIVLLTAHLKNENDIIIYSISFLQSHLPPGPLPPPKKNVHYLQLYK